MRQPVIHGGADALGVVAHDFSTNRNACGPCPQAVQALTAAHVAQYPDPHFTRLREQLAQLHGVAVHRIVVAGSSSEFIHRITMHAARLGARQVTLPAHSYADYAQAAANWGLDIVQRSSHALQQGLHWACEPSSPLGQNELLEAAWQQPAPDGIWRVMDCAYAPLRLEPVQAPARDLQHCWQLWSPNKALGMTGVRGAYAIAPVNTPLEQLQALQMLAPSWVLGAHGVAMLHAWTNMAVQRWVQQSLNTLRNWKAQQLALCPRLGWEVLAGHEANFMVARWPQALQGAVMADALAQLRRCDIKLRDCASFGLSGCVRLGVLPPASQAALRTAWQDLRKTWKVQA